MKHRTIAIALTMATVGCTPEPSEVIWSKSFGDNEHQTLEHLSVSGEHILLSGWNEGDLDFGPSALPSGDYEACLGLDGEHEDSGGKFTWYGEPVVEEHCSITAFTSVRTSVQRWSTTGELTRAIDLDASHWSNFSVSSGMLDDMGRAVLVGDYLEGYLVTQRYPEKLVAVFSPTGEYLWFFVRPMDTDAFEPLGTLHGGGVVMRLDTELLAINAEGDERWRRPLPRDLRNMSMATDADGHTILASSVGGDDLVIEKIDMHGQLVWSREIEGTQTTASVDAPTVLVATDGDANVVVAGSFGGALYFEDEPLEATRQGSGHHDLFVAKLAP